VAEDRPEVAAMWARARLRDLEDRYAVSGGDRLEQEIVQTSLRHGVLCRFTAYAAIDTEPATDGSTPHKVTQLVEPPAGWMDKEASRKLRARAPISATYTSAVAAASGSRLAGGNGGGFGAPPMPAAPSAPSASRMPSAPSAPPMPSAPSAAPDLSAVAPMVDMTLSIADDTDVIREQAAAEARLLRESSAEPAYRRRDLLDDLTSRLEALLRHVGSHDALRKLIAVLRDEKKPLEDRWNKALTLLDELVAEPKPRAFWKRG
jgi:Ca-activated chloride channel family protein